MVRLCHYPLRMDNILLVQSRLSLLFLHMLKRVRTNHVFLLLRWDELIKSNIKYFLCLLKICLGSFYCSREFYKFFFFLIEKVFFPSGHVQYYLLLL